MYRAIMLGVMLVISLADVTCAQGGETVQDAQTAAQLGSQYCSFPYAPKVEWSAKRTPTNDWVAWPGDANGPYCQKPVAFIRAQDRQLVCELAKCMHTLPPGPVSPALADRSANCVTAGYYPPTAIRANEQGTATIRVHIDADGSVTAVDLVQSTGYTDLDDGAVQCIKGGWHFRPAMQDGKPVSSMKTFAVKFALQDANAAAPAKENR